MKIQFGKVISFVACLSQMNISSAFTLPSRHIAISSCHRSETVPFYAKDEKLGDVEDKEEIGVRIERDWTYVRDNGDDYVGRGSIELKVFVPNGKVKGCAFFMHGFSQYPRAYRETLMRSADYANVVIIAPETGIFCPFVLKEIFSNLGSLMTDRDFAQFALQMALSEDTKQCIRMVLKDDETFKKFGINKRMPMAVCGHSMGGGLSFPVAANFNQINHVFTMAPAFGVSDFDPIKKGVEKRTVKSSMLLAGYWDLIAKADKVEKISGESNVNKPDSSVFVGISRGLHTGFEDDLVIGKLTLNRVLSLIIGPQLLFERIFIFGLLDLIRGSTGQLDGTEVLMDFFLAQMTKGKKVTAKSADKYLEDNIKEKKWHEKFDIRYGEIQPTKK